MKINLEMKKKMLTDGDNNNSKPIRKDDDQSNRISNGKLKSTTGTPIINNSFKEYIRFVLYLILINRSMLLSDVNRSFQLPKK